MDGAKQLEKTRREIAKKLDKDKGACAAREQELSEAVAALEEAQKRVSAAQNAKRKQAASKLALEVGQWPLLVHHFPCFVAVLATGIVGRLTQVSRTGGDEGGEARAEGEQPTSQGADRGVPSAARQEQRQRLRTGGFFCCPSTRALRYFRMFMPGAQCLHGSRLSV